MLEIKIGRLSAFLLLALLFVLLAKRTTVQPAQTVVTPVSERAIFTGVGTHHREWGEAIINAWRNDPAVNRQRDKHVAAIMAGAWVNRHD